MSPLDKFREQVKIAREFSTYVVQTADEAQALLDEIDARRFDPHLGFLVGALDTPGDDEVV